MSIPKVIWFAGGLAIGAGAGIGGTYIYMKDKFEQKLNEEVNALKAHYVERDKALAKKNEEQKKELEDKVYSDVEVNDFVNYAKLYNDNTGGEDKAAKSYGEVIEENEDVSHAAEIISDVEWEDPDYDTYKKISVDYFEDGAVFETLSGDELDGFELATGDDWTRRFGEFTPGVVYVRNHELKTDYEIIEQEGPHPRPEDE